jgi:DnaJ-class molecular chaperone
MNPKWASHLCKELPWSVSFGTELPNGLFVCKCLGYGYVEEEPGDFYSQTKCPYCKGTGQIPKRILNKIEK